MKKAFLKKIIIFFLMLTSSGATYSSESDILREIKNLREDMNKRFEQVDKRFEQIDKRFEQVDKRFEQVDKRFEQIDKRFEQFMWFFGLWVPVSMAVVGYILQRISKQDDRLFHISGEKNNIDLDKFIAAIKKADPETKKRLKDVLKG